MRFELIDRVVHRDDTSLIGHKAVTTAEEYLADHFPGFPVLPGVLMLECLVQAARLFLTGGESPLVDPQGDPLIVREVRNVTYGNMVRPGQVLVAEVTLRKAHDDAWDMAGIGRVDDTVAVKGRFQLTQLTGHRTLAS